MGEPQFANRCDKWKFFNAWIWNDLLSKQPQFAGKCDKWEEFDASNWNVLLENQPQFVEYAKHYTSGWVAILIREPELAEECYMWMWGEFDADDWHILLEKQPQFAVKCDKFGELNKRKKLLLQEQPILKKYFPELNLFPEKKEMRITRFI